MFSTIAANRRRGVAVDQSELPHRYWRFLFAGNSANAIALSRIQMRETSGGSDRAAGGTVVTSGTWVNPGHLVDSDDSTFGYTGSNATRSNTFGFGVDFGSSSGTWPVIREAVLRNRSDVSTQGPTLGAVQYSDNGASWKNAWFFSLPDWSSAGQARTLTKPPEALNKRIFDVAVPPTDAGPYALALTPEGNATTGAGRFIFDGSGDSYASTSPPVELYRLPLQTTIEMDAVIQTGSGFKGLWNFGTSSSRLLLACNDGALEVWLDSQGAPRLTVPAVFGSTPRDVKVQLDGPGIRAFVDGQLVASGTHNTGPPLAGFRLGRDPVASARSMLGGFAGARVTRGLV